VKPFGRAIAFATAGWPLAVATAWVAGTSVFVRSSCIFNTEGAGGPLRAAENGALRDDEAVQAVVEAHRVATQRYPFVLVGMHLDRPPGDPAADPARSGLDFEHDATPPRPSAALLLPPC